jgi:predicted transcriptional regulator of viral defense system
VWIGTDRKARKPKLHWPPLHIVWWSDVALTEGIIAVNVAGVTIRITSPARTVADCFKYRNKIGVDVAIEALRDYRRKKKGSLDELHRMTKICRVARVVHPYLEAMT